MKQDVSNICYQGTHMFFMMTVAFPSIAVWVVGIPLFALILLIRNRRVLNLMMKK